MWWSAGRWASRIIVLSRMAQSPARKRAFHGENDSRGQTVWGTPAREIGKFKEAYAWYARLPELGARIKELETQMQAKRRRRFHHRGHGEHRGRREINRHAVANYCRRRTHPKHRETQLVCDLIAACQTKIGSRGKLRSTVMESALRMGTTAIAPRRARVRHQLGKERQRNR